MRIFFRADAGRTMGQGHVMRCLTLADALARKGASIGFVCREHEGHLCDLIEARGHGVHRLPRSESSAGVPPAHAGWLGAAWAEDAAQTRAALAGARPDWLVVDHYALDARWESVLRPSVGRILAIDDLADRGHDCDQLLDQNFDNPLHRRYARQLPPGAKLMLGPDYALVRPEFIAHRAAALQRRDGRIGRVLISMGGSDPHNDTATALAGVAGSGRRAAGIDVVIGQSNPHRAALQAACAGLPDATLHVQTSRMAELMTRADLAINGGGGITWERCVVGLPAIVSIQSDNQAAIAEAVGRAGGHRLLGWSRDLTPGDYGRAIDGLTPEELRGLARTSAGVCDGRGAERVADRLQPGNS